LKLIRVKLTITILCILVTVGVAQANWYEDTAWINTLSGEEQNVVLVLISGNFSKNIMDTVYKNALKNSEDRLWMAKTEAIGKKLLSELASNSPEMRKVMSDGSAYLIKLIRGEITIEKYTKLADNKKEAFGNIINSLNNENVEKIATKYKTKIERTSKSLIVYAKYISAK
jgi:hypothetical protein